MKQALLQRAIPSAGDTPKVVIIGGGIAGLTVAHELLRVGRFDIEVVEKRKCLGGKARTEFDAGKFQEHSMRVLPGSYVCMHQILEEVTTSEGTLIDRLRPVTITMVHKGKKHVVHGDYTSFLKRLRYFFDVPRLLWFIWRSGVSFRDLSVFLYKIGRLWCIPSRQVIAELSRLRFSQYVSGDSPSKGFEEVIFRLAEILVAAKSYASAGVVSKTLLEWFVTPFLVGKHVRRAVSEFDGSTSDALIEPWADWLRSKGVRFREARVKELPVEAARVTEATLIDAGPLDADVYVLAVQHNIADALLAEDVKHHIPGLVDFPRLGEEWAHSVQFQLAEPTAV